MPPVDQPLVTAAHDGRRRVVASADRAASVLGLRRGMPLAHAQAMLPGLAVAEADPNGDADALGRLAFWLLRYAPLTSADPPDGIWVDAAGCAHLHSGEAAMLTDMVERLRHSDIQARAAVADTPGAAHAVARHGSGEVTVVPSGREQEVLAPMSVAALRLQPDTVDRLRRLGFDTVGQLAAIQRAPLARRHGPEVALRLDQACGRVFEPIVPILPPETVGHRVTFLEPLMTAEAFATVIGMLVGEVCHVLERTGRGARQLDLLFERVDGRVEAVRVGTARPSRDPRHLARLLDEHLEEVDPGLGVEAMRLVVPLAEAVRWEQGGSALDGSDRHTDISGLVDRLLNRLGADRVFRAVPVESDVPERSVGWVPALAPPGGADWPPTLPRPGRLFDPPQPVLAMSVLPDAPPVSFTWRRVRHRVRHADGPERIHGEWWRRHGEVRAVRDYWRVEDEQGRRFWLFRRGDGADPETGGLEWFLHGLF